MTLRQIGQLILLSALWGAVFMLIKARQYKKPLLPYRTLPVWT